MPASLVTLVPVTGEVYFQPAIALACAGQPVSLIHEIDNPFASHAIRVLDLFGMTLGYASTGTGLHRALVDERQGCSARIRSVARNDIGLLRVTLEVKLLGLPVETRFYDGWQL